MTDVKPRHYITGIIIFTLIILSGIGILNAIANESSVPSTFLGDEYSDFVSATDKQTELQGKIVELESKLKQDEKPNALEILNLLFWKGFSVLSGLFGTFAFFEDTIAATGNIFGLVVPAFVPLLIISLITTMLVFSIVSAILNRDL